MNRILKSILIIILCVAFTGMINAQDFNKVKIHGFISQGALWSNHNNFFAKTTDLTSHFNELGINFSTKLNDKLHVGIQFTARDFGNTGNDRIVIDWAYADYRFRDWFGVRVGQMKSPFGLFNKIRDIDMLRTCIILPQSVYTESMRENMTSMKGIGLYGNFSLGAAGSLDYDIMYGSMNVLPDGGSAKTIENFSKGMFDMIDFDVSHILLLNFSWETPLEGFKLGFSHINVGTYDGQGKMMTDLIVPIPVAPFQMTVISKLDPMKFTTTFKAYNLFLQYNTGNLTLTGEYTWRDQDLRFYLNALEMPKDMRILGYYGMLNYRFNDYFEAGVYYSEYFRDRNDKDGLQYEPNYDGYLKDLCFSTRFDITESWLIKLEGHFFNGTASLHHIDNMTDGQLDLTKKWFLFAAKTTFSF